MTQNNDIQTHANGIAQRAKAIITAPDKTWPIIATETDTPKQVFLRYVMPLAAIGPLAGFIGGQVFGYGGFGISVRPSFMGGLATAITSYVLSLASIWLMAWVANFLSPKFGGKDDYGRAFLLMAYAMTAAWLAGIFGLIPALGILAIVGLYSLYLFYKGATPMMGVPQDQAVVYTVVTVIVGIVVNIVIGMIAAAITGPSLLAGNLAGADSNSQRTSIDLGEYGSIEVSEDGSATRATFTVDGEEMTVNVDEDVE